MEYMDDLLKTPELPVAESGSTVTLDPSPPTSPSVSPQSSPKIESSGSDGKQGNRVNYLLTLAVLVIGFILGFLVFKFYPGKGPVSTPVKSESGLVSLPSDAVLIQHCADHKGSLFIKPSDIPQGPVYMISNDKLIGIEYMLGKDDFLSGKSYQNLAGLGFKVDHVNIGLLSQGHEGYTAPHYHVDLYNVARDVEQKILCPGSSPIPATSSATPSAVPATPSAN